MAVQNFGGGTALFQGRRLSEILRKRRDEALDRIGSTDDSQQLEDEMFLTQLVEDATLSPIEFSRDAVEKEITTSQGYDVARFRVPFSGDPDLLRYQTNKIPGGLPRGNIEDNHIVLDFTFSDSDDPQTLEDEVSRAIDALEEAAEASRRQIEQHRETVEDKVRSKAEERYVSIQDREDSLDDVEL